MQMLALSVLMISGDNQVFGDILHRVYTWVDAQIPVHDAGSGSGNCMEVCALKQAIRSQSAHTEIGGHCL